MGSTAASHGRSLLDPDETDLQAMSSSHPVFRLLTRVNTPSPYVSQLHIRRGTLPSDLSKPAPADDDYGDYTETERLISFAPAPPSSPEDPDSGDESDEDGPVLGEDESALGDFSDVFAFLESQKEYWHKRKITCKTTQAPKGSKKKRRGIRGKNKPKTPVDQRGPETNTLHGLALSDSRDLLDNSETETLVPDARDGTTKPFTHNIPRLKHLGSNRRPALTPLRTFSSCATPSSVANDTITPTDVRSTRRTSSTPGLSSSESTMIFDDILDHEFRGTAPQMREDVFFSPHTNKRADNLGEGPGKVGFASEALARSIRDTGIGGVRDMSFQHMLRPDALGFTASAPNGRTSRPILKPLPTTEKERSLTRKLVTLFGSLAGPSSFYPPRMTSREGPAPTMRTTTRRYYQAERTPGDNDGEVAVFIDNSNVVIGFIEWAKKSGWNKPKRPRLDYVSLLAILERGRSVWRRVLVGSTPLHQGLEAVFKHNYDIALLEVRL
jgi:hypothetical protein